MTGTSEETRRAFQALSDRLEGDVDRALETLGAGLEDAIAVLRVPDNYRLRLRTTNALDRLIQEVRRREKVIRIFPREASAHRLLGADLAETTRSGPPADATSGWTITSSGKPRETESRSGRLPPAFIQLNRRRALLHKKLDLIPV